MSQVEIKSEVIDALVNAGFNVSKRPDGTVEIVDIVNDAKAECIVIGNSIRISAVLFPTETVVASDFNDAVLRLMPFVQLTSVGIVGNHYVAYGSISLDSTDEQIVQEITTLFANIPQLIEFGLEYNPTQSQ